MSMQRVSILTAGVLATAMVSASLTALAADKPAPDFDKAFKRKDADGNGSLSLEEFKKGMPEKALANADKRFKRIDTNGDGSLSIDEFKAGMQPKKKNS